jgi:hypothetical protein
MLISPSIFNKIPIGSMLEAAGKDGTNIMKFF